jgi:ATP-dependent exoDNAse (exonuclease V) beta subunit
MIDSNSDSNIHYLSSINPHERDQCITFDEGPHIYTIRGDPSQYTSVTTWNHRHFEEFDSDKIIDNMMKSKNWKTNKYYGMTKEEIITQWDASRDEASSAGTKLHYEIECYYNNCNTCSSSNTNTMPIENYSLEYSYFLTFAEDYKHLKPYRTEWMIWDSDVKIAGSVDMVFEKEDGSLLIYDWKRCKEITKTSRFNKYALTECINHLPDTNFWHYSLQLNIYKYILQKNYGKKVDGLYLVCLHPSNKNQSYIRIPCADLQKEVSDLFKIRMEEIMMK